MNSNKGTAIIYFSRHASVEGENKSWFKKEAGEKNTLLAKVLIEQSLESIQNLNLPIFHYHEGNQIGATFGEKLANAYADVFAMGYEAVISLGNDTPEIIHIDWENIKNELAVGRCVIGASQRGGAYLIGLTAAAFHKIRFQNLPWKSESLFQSLASLCQEQDKTPLFLQPLLDINEYQDLIKWLHSTKFHPAHALILQILSMGRSPLNPNFGLAKNQLFVDLQLPSRAPPFC